VRKLLSTCLNVYNCEQVCEMVCEFVHVNKCVFESEYAFNCECVCWCECVFPNVNLYKWVCVLVVSDCVSLCQ
jgi:hypothetical protein